jgi:hypothetical protein
MTSSNRKKFALMAIGMSKGSDMRDPRDTYQNQLVPMVANLSNLTPGSFGQLWKTSMSLSSHFEIKRQPPETPLFSFPMFNHHHRGERHVEYSIHRPHATHPDRGAPFTSESSFRDRVANFDNATARTNLLDQMAVVPLKGVVTDALEPCRFGY